MKTHIPATLNRKLVPRDGKPALEGWIVRFTAEDGTRQAKEFSTRIEASAWMREQSDKHCPADKPKAQVVKRRKPFPSSEERQMIAYVGGRTLQTGANGKKLVPLRHRPRIRQRFWQSGGAVKSAWVVKYVDLTGVRRLRTMPTKADADFLRKQIEEEIRRGVHEPKGHGITINGLLKLLQQELQQRVAVKDVSRSYVRAFDNMTRLHILPELGSVQARAVSVTLVKEYIARKVSEGLKRKTVQSLLQFLQAILQHGVERELLTANVLRVTRYRIPAPMAAEVHIPSLAELRALAESITCVDANSRAAAVVGLALFGGLRAGEVAALRWEDVDLIGQKISVRHAYSDLDGLKAPKTKSGQRTVAIAAPLRAIILAWWNDSDQPSEGFLFCAGRARLVERPTSPSQLTRQCWKPVAERLGIRKPDGSLVNFHALRHAAVSLWLRAGMPPLEAKAMIGHSSLDMTMGLYGHIFSDDAKRRQDFADTSALLIADAAGDTTIIERAA